MTEHLTPDWLNEAGTHVVLRALGWPELDVRFVGGCVRDAMAGRPVSDLDIATPDVPQRVTARLMDAGLKAIPTGLAHGTVTAVGAHRNFEVTTLRRDTACDGRHAMVEFTTDWEEDARRRDFTVNAMSLRPDGTVFDYFGGRRDLEAGRLRFVGDPADRIREDYLRILRLFRFQAHYGRVPIAAATLDACRELKDGLSLLSGERIQHELKRLLAAPHPAAALEAMTVSGVTAKIMPEAAGGEVIAKVVVIEKDIGLAPHWLRRLAAMMKVGTYVMPLATRLRLSNRDREKLAALVAAEPSIGTSMTGPELDLLLLRMGRDRILDRSVLAAARSGNHFGWLPILHRARDFEHRAMPINGDDILAAGLAPGPLVGQALDAAERAWVNSGFTASRADLLKVVQRP